MRILVVEDDASQLELLMRLLEREGFTVEGYQDGATGLYALSSRSYDLAVVDRLLPEMDGLSLLRAYRAAGGAVPVLLLTALSAVGDRVAGLDAGADDYLAKPYAPDELLARIRALLRRPVNLQPEGLCRGDITLYRSAGRLEGPGGSCGLSKRETELMYLLMSNYAQVLSRETILSRVWGNDTQVEERNIDNFVFLVRRRLRNVGSKVQIRTIRGFGYQMEAEHA